MSTVLIVEQRIMLIFTPIDTNPEDILLPTRSARIERGVGVIVEKVVEVDFVPKRLGQVEIFLTDRDGETHCEDGKRRVKARCILEMLSRTVL